jgi:hypothetical protein
MAAGRRIGGIIALIIGFLLILLCISYIIYYWGVINVPNLIINIALAVLALLGAVMAMGNNKKGGPLVLIAGILPIVFAILIAVDPSIFNIFVPYSFLLVYFDVFIPYVTLEAIILVLAAIIIMVSPE